MIHLQLHPKFIVDKATYAGGKRTVFIYRLVQKGSQY